MNLNKNRLDIFIDKYVVHFNGSQAAREAGYSEKTAGAQSSRLLKNVNVQEKIKKKVALLTKKAGVTQQFVLERLRRLATSDITNYIEPLNGGKRLKIKNLHDLPEEMRYAIKKVKEVKLGKRSVGVEIELQDKFQPLHDLASYTKILEGEKQGDQTLVINQSIHYEGLSEETIRKYGLNQGQQESVRNPEPPSEA